MLRAYFDDSRQDEKAGVQGVYTLAGYVGEATKWAQFADAWKEALHAPPRRLDYLKTWQAYKPRDPKSMFYGWTDKEREDKLLLLAKTANAHALISVQTALLPAHYSEIVGGLTEMRPYAFLFYSIAAELVKLLERRWGVKDKIDIYFDRQLDESEDKLRAGFREFIADAPPELKERADLFAWHFRRNIYETNQGNQGLKGPVWDELLNLPRMTGIWDKAKLKAIVQRKWEEIQRKKTGPIMALPDPSSGWGRPWK